MKLKFNSLNYLVFPVFPFFFIGENLIKGDGKILDKVETECGNISVEGTKIYAFQSNFYLIYSETEFS